jgi:quercetin dioxygenase-like cupin family protein
MGCSSSKSAAANDAAPQKQEAKESPPAGGNQGGGDAKAPGTGINCYDASPNNYKVIAELPVGKLIEMTMKPGESDDPHDHPVHHMYVVKGGKLKITADGHSGEKEIPDGAPIIMPAGPHQVSNVGDNDVKIIFLEPTGTVGETPEGHTTPMDTDPDCYKILVEDDDWFIGEMTLAAGAEDHPHSHRDHLVYVLTGDELTIWPGKEKDDEKKMVAPIKPGAALPVPNGFHIVGNTGTTEAKLIFWEAKK